MNRKSFILPGVVLLFVAVMALTKCGGSNSSDIRQDSSSSHINAPAPDNNSANNPSMADTTYQKDSLQRRDSVH